MKPAYIIDGTRTAIGKYGGALSSVRPDDLLAQTLKALMDRNPKINSNAIEDVIAGDANQAGEDCRNVARMAVLLAGFPATVPGNTVNRLCGSGLQAIMDAARAIMCDEGMFYIAGGVESMTRAPFVMAKPASSWNRQPEIFDSTIGWRFTNKRLAEVYPPYSMGETAEILARRWNISREDQDIFALGSQDKYFSALTAGKWGTEICGIDITASKNGLSVFAKDEHPRKTSLEKLAALKPAFEKQGSVTAGNSSGINDGAAALLLASEEAIKTFNLQPLACIRSMAVTGVDPSVMGIGPVEAVRKAAQRASINVSDIGLIELDESFASQSLACIRELGLNPALVNVNGGAIALGHPLGCSGARISVTLIHEMKRRGVQYGLATLSVGLGQGMAMVIEGC